MDLYKYDEKSILHRRLDEKKNAEGRIHIWDPLILKLTPEKALLLLVYIFEMIF